MELYRIGSGAHVYLSEKNENPLYIVLSGSIKIEVSRLFAGGVRLRCLIQLRICITYDVVLQRMLQYSTTTVAGISFFSARLIFVPGLANRVVLVARSGADGIECVLGN